MEDTYGASVRSTFKIWMMGDDFGNRYLLRLLEGGRESPELEEALGIMAEHVLESYFIRSRMDHVDSWQWNVAILTMRDRALDSCARLREARLSASSQNRLVSNPSEYFRTVMYFAMIQSLFGQAGLDAQLGFKEVDEPDGLPDTGRVRRARLRGGDGLHVKNNIYGYWSYKRK